MAYQSHHCSATLLCSTCISVFLHPSLLLYVLLAFYALCAMSHSMHHSSSVHFSCCTLPPSTHLNHSQQQPHLFSVLLFLSVHLLHPLFTMLLHALPMSSALPDHHYNSSASLAVKPMRSSSLGVMPRFLSLSSS
jgi:hypothetical protein